MSCTLKRFPACQKENLPPLCSGLQLVEHRFAICWLSNPAWTSKQAGREDQELPQCARAGLSFLVRPRHSEEQNEVLKRLLQGPYQAGTNCGALPPFQSHLHLWLFNSKTQHLVNISEKQALTDNFPRYFYCSHKYPASFWTLINSWPCQFSGGNESHRFLHCLKMYFLLSVFNLPPFSFIEHLCSCTAQTGKTTAPKQLL